MEFYLAILLFTTTASITPGPNNIMIMASGVNFGVKRSIPHVLGICLGFPVMVIALGLGLGTIFEDFPILHDIIKILGVAYLLYLAWLIASSSPFEEAASPVMPLRFDQAVLFQWVNPKACYRCNLCLHHHCGRYARASTIYRIRFFHYCRSLGDDLVDVWRRTKTLPRQCCSQSHLQYSHGCVTSGLYVTRHQWPNPTVFKLIFDL